VVQGPTIVQAPAVVPAPVVAAFRPGRGVVDAVTALTYPAYPSASSGASTPARQVWRLTVRMDDGTTQTLDQDNRAFQPGDRVEITRDGHVVR
jgi:outer membrane lipoprotein SlyB